MQSVLFTKLFRQLTLEEIATQAQQAYFDSIDLLVRSGHQVEPDKPEQLVPAAHFFKHQGLSVPMVTTDITDPEHPNTERVVAACAEASIPLIRLGYWKYDADRGYATCLVDARHQLTSLAKLAERHGVRFALQLHGGTIHGSGAQAAALLAGIDPKFIGAYPDPGNQTVQEGREDWRFTLDVLRDRLCCIGVKNGGWFPAQLAPSGQRRWHSDWLGLSEGMVPWDDIMVHLTSIGYDGLLSFHSHYEVPLPQAMDQTRSDLQYIQRQMGSLQLQNSHLK